MNEEARSKLWQEYDRTKSSAVREKLIIEYAGLVKIVAGKLSMYLGNNVEYDDLVGYGTFGLIDAIDKFVLTKGVKFETYASLRIRGAILDQIRKMDWIPRTVRQKQKRVEQAQIELESELGRPATDKELASKLEVSEEELDELLEETKVANLVSLDEYMEQGSEVKVAPGKKTTIIQPEASAVKKELKEQLIKALGVLTEKEKKVVVLYYYEDLTLKEISRVLEVSESRVSQLHTKAITKMRGQLGDYKDMLFQI